MERMKLLILDNDDVILRIMKRGLGGEFDVNTFGNAAEACRAIREGFLPDVILSDINMPEMDGVDFREALRGLRPDLLDRFAFCSASAIDERVSDYIARNKVKILGKPATPTDVRAFLAEHGFTAAR